MRRIEAVLAKLTVGACGVMAGLILMLVGDRSHAISVLVASVCATAATFYFEHRLRRERTRTLGRPGNGVGVASLVLGAAGLAMAIGLVAGVNLLNPRDGTLVKAVLVCAAAGSILATPSGLVLGIVGLVKHRQTRKVLAVWGTGLSAVAVLPWATIAIAGEFFG